MFTFWQMMIILDVRRLLSWVELLQGLFLQTSEWGDEDMTNILLVAESIKTQSEPQSVCVPNETNPSDTADQSMDELTATEVEVGHNIIMHDVESYPDDPNAAESSAGGLLNMRELMVDFVNSSKSKISVKKWKTG